ncbi:hypothetical protein LIER_34593 [Lithospermum erythrorhizon]|uniref:Uncharacterized protein n=1 Tax=Lithospermum erythrorhizon TaxID=34254 RepID=A0AAV3S2R9_LITER
MAHLNLISGSTPTLPQACASIFELKSLQVHRKRKRKLEHFYKHKLRASLTPVVDGDITEARKGPLSYASSTSGVLNSTSTAESLGQSITVGSCNSTSFFNFEGNCQDKFFLDDVTDWKSSAKNLMELVVDSDESRNGSTQLSPENLSDEAVMTLDTHDDTQIRNSQSLNRRKKHHLQSARLSTKIQSFISPRSVIPVGSRFQADVPEWNGASLDKAGHTAEDSDCKSSRWLGTQIWAAQNKMESTARVVGKGRPDSCICASPGSVECIRRHILEERLILQCGLGHVFFTWKFDEMGEQTVKSWAVKEQKTFEALVKDPKASGKNFLKHALVSLPRKSSKSIVSYYFNVFVPRRIGQQTRSGHNQVDSDEEGDDSNYMMKYGRRPELRGTLMDSGGGTPRYLRHPS